MTAEAAGRLIALAKRLTPHAAEPLAVRILDAATDSVERILGRKDAATPPLRLRLHVGPFVDPRLYQVSGERNLEAFRELCGLSSETSFLDIGCGPGRVSVPLTRYLSHDGSYEGFDAARGPVEWCQREISSRYPNFRFQHTSAFSQRYNPRGDQRSSNLVFPYEENRFDFAFAGSVYTHMLPEEIANFIAETARVLKTGGISFATFCLLNERSMSTVAAGRSTPPLHYVSGECRVRDPNNPASFIAQPEQFIRETYGRVGLRIDGPIRYGSWAGGSHEESEVLEPYGFNQDIIIAFKL